MPRVLQKNFARLPVRIGGALVFQFVQAVERIQLSERCDHGVAVFGAEDDRRIGGGELGEDLAARSAWADGVTCAWSGNCNRFKFFVSLRDRFKNSGTFCAVC